MKVKSAQYLCSVVRPGDFLDDARPQVAFVGRSNVGKSTLLNRLVGRHGLARISSTPGRTRAINYFEINSSFYFVDLPGYGYARVSKTERQSWANLMASYFEMASGKAMVIQLVDAKVGATELDQQSAEYLRSVGVDPIVVATKADRVKKGKLQATLGSIQRDLGLLDSVIIPFAAPSGEGSKQIWRSIEQYLGSFDSRGDNQGDDHD
ncbi:MAG: YihA family ribosome biogenesis GTP-binding protein [bacterium]|nr:YihA family ribosome biogenesis GTP-binding protein [bacterium]